MAKSIARVRVEIDPKDSPEVAFKRMLIAFRNAYTDAGIANAVRQHETYESKSRKKRRKKRESEVALIRQKLRQNFLQGKNNK
jgi:ribosomal protein S21